MLGRAAQFVVILLGAFAFSNVVMADELSAALSGKTVAGVRDGVHWRQYFDANGVTTFIQKGGRSSYGEWEIRDGRYCSVWPPSSIWTCYDTRVESDDQVTFVENSKGPDWSGKLYEGNRILDRELDGMRLVN